MIRLPRFWERHFLPVEFAIAASLAIGFAVWYLAFGGAAAADKILHNNRPALYGTTASIFGSLLGFVITATSIVLGFSTSDHLAVVRDSSEYPKLWKTFSATIRALGLSTIVALACLLFDRDASPNRWSAPVLTFVVLLSRLRISRTVWVLVSVREVIESLESVSR